MARRHPGPDACHRGSIWPPRVHDVQDPAFDRRCRPFGRAQAPSDEAGALRSADGEDVRLRLGSQVGRLEGDEGVSVVRGPHEFDLEGVVAVNLDDGSYIAGAQPVLRNVVDQDNRLERIECDDALGTTVTSLTNGLPGP